jgi:hypothetical protein
MHNRPPGSESLLKLKEMRFQHFEDRSLLKLCILAEIIIIIIKIIIIIIIIINVHTLNGLLARNAKKPPNKKPDQGTIGPATLLIKKITS